MRRFISTGLGLTIFLLAARSDSADSQPAGADITTAMTLVRQALDADLADRRDDRVTLLRQAVEQAPLYAPARWHSGELLHGDRWLPVRDAQQQVFADRRLKEYRQLRDSLDGSAAAHATLARWCRKQQWKDREEFHWYGVLNSQPRNKEAIAALRLKEYRGMWLTDDGIALHKQHSQRSEEAFRHWQTILTQARIAIDDGDSTQRGEAIERVRSIRDPAALPALAQSLSQAKEAYALAAVFALAKIDEQLATDVLAWQAVAAPQEAVRQAAIDALQPRPWHSFVPSLMGSLTSPLELTYYINSTAPGDLKYGYQVLRDGPLSQTSYIYGVNSEIFRTSATPLAAHPRFASARDAQLRDALQARAAVQQQVNGANQVTEWQNERVYTALEQATGEKHSPTPQSWWKWWEEHNGLSLSDQKPIYSRHVYRRVAVGFDDRIQGRPSGVPGRLVALGPAPAGTEDRTANMRRHHGHGCCFMAGTLVWTEAGLEPIQDLRPGDRVVSQDPDTGELALRFVQEVGLRPATAMRRLQVGQDVVVATMGHPFWTVGKGWRMVKQIEPADRLHTVSGGAAIERLEDGPHWEAHNLVVEGFGTYFVGKAGLLVRDNNLGEVLNTPLPGYRVVAAVAQPE